MRSAGIGSERGVGTFEAAGVLVAVVGSGEGAAWRIWTLYAGTSGCSGCWMTAAEAVGLSKDSSENLEQTNEELGLGQLRESSLFAE